MIETALAFDGLVGVVTTPDGAPGADVACLIPNSGLIHRIGPHRLAVRLARRLAERGAVTLRFDLAGVGDSAPRAEGGDYRERATRDLRAAMDALESTCGIRRFVVFGICSGAVNGFWTAVADPRVVGVLMYDGFWYRSPWTQWVRLYKRWRALGAAEILGSARRNVRRLWQRTKEQDPAIFGSWDMDNPPLSMFIEHCNALAGRGVSLYFVYGGTVLEYYSYARQFQHVFGREPFARHARCDYRPELDHMLTTRDAQQKMLALADAWYQQVAVSAGRDKAPCNAPD